LDGLAYEKIRVINKKDAKAEEDLGKVVRTGFIACTIIWGRRRMRGRKRNVVGNLTVLQLEKEIVSPSI
jgi:hypothetical protein